MQTNLKVSSVIKISRVREEYNILHIIFHRNKNQHRRSKWWKWLVKLKTATLSLLAIGSNQELVDRRLLHLAEFFHAHVVPGCYRYREHPVMYTALLSAKWYHSAFSTVIADPQFSTLGTVLFATLARLRSSVKAENISSV